MGNQVLAQRTEPHQSREAAPDTGLQAEAGHVGSAKGMIAEMRSKRLQYFLKARRDHLQLSQEEVAKRLEISARAYGNWERGKVKKWTDRKLYGLAEALEMSEFQTARLFLIAVDRAPRSDLRAIFRRPPGEDPATSAFLGDYSAMMDALSLPTFLVDHGWNVKMANRAYRDLFRNIRAYPAAMPSANFLRFGLFHPDAPTVLVDHAKWQMAMLAQLTSNLELHDQDPALQTIRRDVCRHPVLRHVYLKDMPNWVLDCGADLIHHEAAVRELRHPDPQFGVQKCRLVEETPRRLQALGLTRITLVLVSLDRRYTREQGRSHNHHAA